MDYRLRRVDNFVYLHIVMFAFWMLFFEAKPWPTLTLAVTLEAIFLSAFVLIGQNRQASFQQAKADHDLTEQEMELKTNTELTREIPGSWPRCTGGSSRALAVAAAETSGNPRVLRRGESAAPVSSVVRERR